MTLRKRKNRGHNRLQKQIDNWRLDNLALNIDYIKRNERGHIDIVVHPWCDIPIINSWFPEPNGKTKQKILSGLLDIYESWKKQLDNLNEPYYLKIWLYEQRFSKSEVVCALGSSLDYYRNVFYKPDYIKRLNPNSYGSLANRVSKFKWDFYLDEDIHDNTTVGDQSLYESARSFEETKKWFNKLLKKPHRTEKLKEKIEDVDELYFFKRGNVWVGGQ
jgi:hypothetical protein